MLSLGVTSIDKIGEVWLSDEIGEGFPFLPVEFPVMMIPSDLKNFAAFAVSTMLTSDVTL